MSKDDFRIDSHKLLYHPRRVGDWLDGKTIYPLYMEISPSGACNHRCRFCGLDFAGYKPRFLEIGLLGQRLEELGRLGLKSIMYAGEGEPFLHRDMVSIIKRTRDSGIDVALTTNAVLMRRETSEQILDAVEWIKVSLNAGTPETYAAVHGTQASDFGKVLANLEAAVSVRAKAGARCTLGAQIILLPENMHEVEILARTVRDIGLDYLVVKPYSQHPQSITTSYRDVSYAETEELDEKLAALATESFSPIVRLRAMRKWDEKTKPYGACQALPFWSYIDAGGGVWGCSVFLGDERFLYGNIHDDSFESIWTGQRRRSLLEWFDSDFDCGSCRLNCRMDEINRYLWELRYPPAHVNFI